MLMEPPSYSTVEELDLPKYSDVAANISSDLTPPPPYVASIGSAIITNLPSHVELSRAIVDRTPNWFIENSCKLAWILFLNLLSVLHIVLFIIVFQCPLPKTSLAGTRAFLFLHIIFIVATIIYCARKYKSRMALTFYYCFKSALLCTGIPVGITIIFGSFIWTEMNELRQAIQRPVSVANTYACSLTFYEFLFTVMILNYVGIPVIIIIFFLCFICFKVVLPSCRRHYLQNCCRSTTAEDWPQSTVF